MLILSIFPGVDLLGRGFELEAFCVVRGPDLLWGGDVRAFHPPPGKFDGLIAGSPCQDFSRKRRRRQTPPTGYGLEMLSEFVRVVLEAQPDWWLLENVPTVPDVQVPGYVVQRLDLNARECGSTQDRLRHFQFGSREGLILVPRRAPVTASVSQKTVLATEGRRKHRRGWIEFCQLQGLPGALDLPGMTIEARYMAVGNGVHLDVARTLARAVREACTRTEQPRVCLCNCGRVVTGKQQTALPGCRKRLERRRKRDCAAAPVLEVVTDQADAQP